MALYRERPSPDMRQPLGRKLQVRWQRQGGGIDASGFAAKKYAALRVGKAAYRVLFLCRNNRRLRDLEPEEPREEALLLALFVGFVLLLYLLGVLRFVMLRLDVFRF